MWASNIELPPPTPHKHFFSPFPSSQKTANVILNFGELVNINANAPAQGEADVLLGALSKLSGAENVLPRHQIQQEQHSTVGQMVLQLPVSTNTILFYFYIILSYYMIYVY